MINSDCIQPPYLKKGDQVGIIAPAGIVKPEDIEPAIKILEEWGLKVNKGKHLYRSFHFFAGTDEQRLNDFQTMINDENIRAVFFARGGYGIIRLIEKLNFRKFKKSPKWLVGYSDITIVHSFLSKILKCESLHGIMPKNFIKGQEDNQSLIQLKNTLFGNMPSYQFANNRLNRSGKAEGFVTGGNLSIIYSLQRTKLQIDTKGKILFIEDVNEYLYHFERMMMNLKMSGQLKNLAGLVVGGLTDMKETTPGFGKTAEEIIADVVKECTYPVMFGFPVGHMFPNLPLIVGRKMKMDVDLKKVELTYL